MGSACTPCATVSYTAATDAALAAGDRSGCTSPPSPAAPVARSCFLRLGFSSHNLLCRGTQLSFKLAVFEVDVSMLSCKSGLLCDKSPADVGDASSSLLVSGLILMEGQLST